MHSVPGWLHNVCQTVITDSISERHQAGQCVGTASGFRELTVPGAGPHAHILHIGWQFSGELTALPAAGSKQACAASCIPMTSASISCCLCQIPQCMLTTQFASCVGLLPCGIAAIKPQAPRRRFDAASRSGFSPSSSNRQDCELLLKATRHDTMRALTVWRPALEASGTQPGARKAPEKGVTGTWSGAGTGQSRRGRPGGRSP